MTLSEIWMTGAATMRFVTAWLVSTGVGGVVIADDGEMTCAASAISEAGPALFCVATTPNAARPNVSNAAMPITTTRITPSATSLTELGFK